MIIRFWHNPIILLLLAVVVTSCVDHSYDFDHMEPSLVAVGGDDLTLPLARSGRVTAGDLLGERMGQYIHEEPNGDYIIQYVSDSITFTFDGLKDYDGSGPFRRYINYPISYGFPFFSKPDTPTFDKEGVADLTGMIPATIDLGDVSRTKAISVPRLPDELLALKSIRLSDDSCFEFTLTIPNCMFTEGTVLPDLNIDLSEFFESRDAEDGILKFNTPLDASNGYTVTKIFHLDKVVFNPDNYDPKTHTLMLQAGLRFSGSCTLSDLKTDRTHYAKAPATTVLRASVVLLKVDCEAVEGIYEYHVDKNTTLDMSDLVEKVTSRLGEGFSLASAHPEVLLDANTNIPVPTWGKVDIQAKKNRARYAEIKNILVDFPYAAPGETATGRIRLSDTPQSDPDVEDVFVDFTKLMSRIPDEIQVSVDASTYTDKSGELQLGESYRIGVTPQLRIPLALGTDMKLEIRDTIPLPETLGKLMKDNDPVLTGELVNSLPLDIDMTLIIVNDAGISLIEPATQHISAKSTVPINIPLVNLVEDGIVWLNRAILTFQVTGTQEAQVLNANDYMEADLRLRMPGGYHFTL
jgi:hypothetical protein